jgi:hypothetical protein
MVDNEGKRPQGLFRVVHFLPADDLAVQKLSRQITGLAWIPRIT